MSDQKTEQNTMCMCMLMNYNYIIIIIMQNRKADVFFFQFRRMNFWKHLG